MFGNGVLICTMKNDMETIAFSEAVALQAKREPAVLLRGGKVFLILERMTWDLE